MLEDYSSLFTIHGVYEQWMDLARSLGFYDLLRRKYEFVGRRRIRGPGFTSFKVLLVI